jgi:hypothetical protein
MSFLEKDEVPYKLVIEAEEREQYEERFEPQELLVLPFSNLGQGSIPARNWVWEHARESGAARHWILDDNIRRVYRYYRERRIPCTSGPAFAAVEDLTDRYENVGVSGMNYNMFGHRGMAPFFVNVHVYSCMLIDCSLPYRWRGRYNEDTDLCLQVLAGGLCTILVNAFLAHKVASMTMRGGNTDELYADDGRANMARSLERMWPGVVETKRRWGRPQHVIKKSWRGFDTPLKLREGVKLGDMTPDEYGLTLRAVRPPRSERLREILDEAERTR